MPSRHYAPKKLAYGVNRCADLHRKGVNGLSNGDPNCEHKNTGGEMITIAGSNRQELSKTCLSCGYVFPRKNFMKKKSGSKRR